MMTARQVIDSLNRNLDLGHVHLMDFVDSFRRAERVSKLEFIQEAPKEKMGRNEGLVAAVISALCREKGMRVPEWVGNCASPDPYYVIPAKSAEFRLRLMLESPPSFRIRNVFVPENFLHRA